MRKKQVFNPFLPLNEYIPDGEPHVFGDRVYLYGSHDHEGGYTFCMDDYTVYSAPVDDLTDWRKERVIYEADQDPAYPELCYMYAPDVCREMMENITCITRCPAIMAWVVIHVRSAWLYVIRQRENINF